jgi:broad specificity phosphatase PhoE
MTTFLLMRHGEPDFSGPRKWKAPGWGADLAPLTGLGEKQVLQQLDRIREFNPVVGISSPLSRALHSSLVLCSRLGIPFKVEFDLHEWVPDSSFRWQTLDDVLPLQADYHRCQGKYPPGETRPWETLASVRSRSLAVLRRYLGYRRVLVVCHGELIRALTGETKTEYAGLVPFELFDL